MDVLNLLIDIGLNLAKEKNLKKLLEKIIDAEIEYTKAEGGSLYIKDGEWLKFVVFKNRVLEQKLDKDKLSKIIKFGKFKVSQDSIVGRCALKREKLMIKNLKKDLKILNLKYDDSIDKKLNYETQSIYALPLTAPDNELIGVLELINLPQEAFLPFHTTIIDAIASQAAISLSYMLLMEKNKKAHLEMIYRLAKMAEYKDTDTGEHIKRVSFLSFLLAKEIKDNLQWAELVLYASPLHDIGKVGIPDSILTKPGKLTKEEFEIMKTHTVIGGEILKGSEIPLIKIAQKIALYHHERYDGLGYPYGLKGEEIPLEARITTVADVFDALVSKRPYKEPWDFNKAFEYINAQKGKQFDPRVVDAFVKVFRKMTMIYKGTEPFDFQVL